MRNPILNSYYKVLLPVDLLRRYESLSIKFNRGLATTLRNVLAATIDEAESAGKKLYKYSTEEDQFDELASQVDEVPDGHDGEGPSARGQAANDRDAEHPPEDHSEEGTEVRDDGGNVDDGAAEAGGEPPASAPRKVGRPRKTSKRGR
jgi:hypothetical protein